MKKILFALMFTVILFFSTNFGAQASSVKSGDIETESFVPITSWWYETLPIPYKGRKLFKRISRHGQCLDGYLMARNIGAAKFIYEGYLYPCDGDRPIPLLKPIEEVNQ